MPATTFNLEPDYVTGLGNVTDFRFLPDGRMVIVNRMGTVFVRPAGGGTLINAGTFPVNSGPDEQGLLGVAVTPNFATSGELVFYYSAGATATPPGSNANRQRVVKRKLMANNMLEPIANEVILIQNLRGPANHNGGALDIGADGMVYVGVGDTGCNSGTIPEPIYTPTNFYGTCLSDNATNKGGGNGKILRVNLDGSIPATNPLVGQTAVTACGTTCGTPIAAGSVGAARTEVYAWGFRNPWRIWSDPMTGKLWVGDVGEVAYEEITIAQMGRHHGWPWREGQKGHPLAKCRDVQVGGTAAAPVMDQDCVDPVYYCRHSRAGLDTTVDPNCTSISGGQIVDSCDWPTTFRGKYFFGDNANGEIWTLQPNAGRDGITGGRSNFASITNGSPVSIRTGTDGALYIAVLPGRIARISPKAPVQCPPGLDGGVIIPPLPDAAVVVDDAGNVIDAAAVTPDSSTTTGGGSSEGCGCRAGGRSHVPAGLPLAGLLLVLGLVAWRRRK